MTAYTINIGDDCYNFIIPEPKYNICDLVIRHAQLLDLHLPCLCYLDTEQRSAVIKYIISLSWTKMEYSRIHSGIVNAIECQEKCPSDLYDIVDWDLGWKHIVSSKVPKLTRRIKNKIDNDMYIKAYKHLVNEIDAKKNEHSH